ncbi:DUF3344 domain-containing protein [Priestia megaterium]|uniref:DUF3344 domain-containing protein n=1 Tax=Priestia megaterium TaxID=1404 RepID=UPI003EE9C9B7
MVNNGQDGVCNNCNPKSNVKTLQNPLTEFLNLSLKGDYAATGVGLRDSNTGTIDMSSLIPAGSTIFQAFLYWEALENEGTLSNTGTLNGKPITGTLISTDRDLCWGLQFTHYFRADVTKISNIGINNIKITLGGPETLLDGASLVIVFTNENSPLKQIIIYDGGVSLTGSTDTTTISGFVATSPVQAHTTFIVGDGQNVGATALFNSTTVGTFVGADGPLWDTVSADISALIDPGDTSATTTVQSPRDCVGWISQVFSITIRGK